MTKLKKVQPILWVVLHLFEKTQMYVCVCVETIQVASIKYNFLNINWKVYDIEKKSTVKKL